MPAWPCGTGGSRCSATGASRGRCISRSPIPSLADIRVITLECPDGEFASIAALHPPASRLERTIHDLYGLRALGAPDRRPWLDHGRWRSAARRPAASYHTDAAYPFLPVEGESLHQIPVGPVHAGIIEPGHFRFTASGETVVRLEQRLGYVHKGIESLMVGAPLDKAAQARRACVG